MIKKYHILIGGFTQERATSGNGIDQLESLIYEQYGGKQARCVYLPWYCNTRAIARWIQKYSDLPSIQIAGYSFGGQTAVDLAEELSKMLLPVERMTLVDAVCRRTRLPIGWLAAVNPLASINVPENVEYLSIYRQNVSWPRGHKIRVTNMTEVVCDEMIDCSHTVIDNLVPIRLRILSDADALHALDVER